MNMFQRGVNKWIISFDRGANQDCQDTVMSLFALIGYGAGVIFTKNKSELATIIGNHPLLSKSYPLLRFQMLTGTMHGMPVLNVLQKYNGTKYVYLYDYEAKTSKEMRLCGKYLGMYSPSIVKEPSIY